MASHKNELKSLINWTAFKSHRDEVTHKKIQRHLTDINDIISEDDIRNIDIYALVAGAVDAVISKKQHAGLAM